MKPELQSTTAKIEDYQKEVLSLYKRNVDNSLALIYSLALLSDQLAVKLQPKTNKELMELLKIGEKHTKINLKS